MKKDIALREDAALGCTNTSPELLSSSLSREKDTTIMAISNVAGAGALRPDAAESEPLMGGRADSVSESLTGSETSETNHGTRTGRLYQSVREFCNRNLGLLFVFIAQMFASIVRWSQ